MDKSLAIVTLLVTFGMQIIRASLPIVYRLGEQKGYGYCAMYTLLVFATPIFFKWLLRFFSAKKLFYASAIGVAIVRVALQFAPGNLILTSLGIILVLSSVLWTIALIQPIQIQFVPALFMGMILDTTLCSAFITWDYIWQSGFLPYALTIVTSGVFLWFLWEGVNPYWEAAPNISSYYALLGPILFLQILCLQNVAFVASSANISLPFASAIVLLGNILALAMVIVTSSFPLSIVKRIIIAAIAIFSIYLVFYKQGRLLATGIVMAQGTLGVLVAIIANKIPDNGEKKRPGGTMAGILFVLLTLLYQIHYQVSLPISNKLLPLLAISAIAISALPKYDICVSYQLTRKWKLLFLVLPCFVAPIYLWISTPLLETMPTDKELKLINYNVHQSINMDNRLDPEGIAQVIIKQKPQVVILQEVGRGWPIGGGLDLAEWLSRRLLMSYVYVGSADPRFGNAIFTNLPIKNRDKGFLPQSKGSMVRSFVKIETLYKKQPLYIIGTHLQHKRRNTDVRIAQIHTLLKQAWQNKNNSIIAGDMNAIPKSKEMNIYSKAGFISAQDSTGHNLPTIKSYNPKYRIDWILGTSNIKFSNFSIPRTTASDHLPMVVTIK